LQSAAPEGGLAAAANPATLGKVSTRRSGCVEG
jgi:hypothetical protein